MTFLPTNSGLLVPGGDFDEQPKIERETGKELPLFQIGDKLGRMIIRGKIEGTRATVSDQIRQPWDTLDGLSFPWQYRMSAVSGLQRVVAILLRSAWNALMQNTSAMKQEIMKDILCTYAFPILMNMQAQGKEGFVTLWFEMKDNPIRIEVTGDQEQIVKRPKRDRRKMHEANFDEIDRYLNQRKSIVIDGFAGANKLDGGLN